MYSTLTGAFFLLGIGILIAHAMEGLALGSKTREPFPNEEGYVPVATKRKSG